MTTTSKPKPSRATYSDPLVTEVRDACARLMFLDAWASAIETGECPACGSVDSEADSECAEVVGLRDSIMSGKGCPECGREIPRASSGDDWADACSDLPTPESAYLTADEVVSGLGGEVKVREALEAWDSAMYRGEPLAEFEVDSESPERFGTLLAYEALGHGIGLRDDMPTGSSYIRPRVPSVEFHYTSFDGGALLACSDGCLGIVPGESGVERCDDCGRAFEDDDAASIRFGRLLAQSGKLGEAFRLLDDDTRPTVAEVLLDGGALLDAAEREVACEALRSYVDSGDPESSEFARDASALLDRLSWEPGRTGSVPMVETVSPVDSELARIPGELLARVVDFLRNASAIPRARDANANGIACSDGPSDSQGFDDWAADRVDGASELADRLEACSSMSEVERSTLWDACYSARASILSGNGGRSSDPERVAALEALLGRFKGAR